MSYRHVPCLSWPFAHPAHHIFQDNVVQISILDRDIGNRLYLNALDGGELGQRILLGLINLEFKVWPA